MKVALSWNRDFSLKYLAALEQKGVPDVEVGLHRNVVDEDTEEPVEGEHGGVDAVLSEVGSEPRQLFCQQLLQDLLIHLGRKRTISVRAFLDK